MYHFPEGLYTDVRIEDVFETLILVTLGEIEEFKDKRYTAAFVRLYDGRRWFYAATTDVDSIQREIDSLAALASPHPGIDADEIVRAFEVNRGEYLAFTGADDVSTISKQTKYELLSGYLPAIDGRDLVVTWTGASSRPFCPAKEPSVSSTRSASGSGSALAWPKARTG